MKLDYQELALYILAGLDTKFNTVVSAMDAQVELVSLNELSVQHINFEQCLDLR
jgi:hypothetical protein